MPTFSAPMINLYSLDVPHTADFYIELGFVETFRTPESGEPEHIELALDGFTLGIASIEASRIELAVAKLGNPQQFYAFHRKVYAQRGTTDGNRAFDIARGLGLDAKKLVAVGNSDGVRSPSQRR